MRTPFKFIGGLTFTLALAGPLAAADFDAGAAEALAKKSNCSKCHSPTNKKEGPAYKETAAKYKGKADAEEKLYIHLTTSPTIKVEGKDEKHDNPKTKKEADIRNLVRWVLSH